MEDKNIKYNLIGKTYGYWTVLSYNSCDKHGRTLWNCKCVCGQEKIVPSPTLRLGKSKSCGCRKHEFIRQATVKNILGQRFGNLVVTVFSHYRGGYAYWNTLCDCGNSKIVRIDSLTTGNTKSCGCFQKAVAGQRVGDKNPMWRGGSPKLYPKEWDNSLRESIRNRDGRICQYPECTYDDTKITRKLHVHHIDGNKFNCQDYNLISLCTSHHMAVEKTSPESWQNYFYAITGDYQYA